MSDVKISGLPAASQANNADLIEKVDSLSGLNQKVTVAQIAARLGPGPTGPIGPAGATGPIGATGPSDALWTRSGSAVSVIGGKHTIQDNGGFGDAVDFNYDPVAAALQLGITDWSHVYVFPGSGQFILSYNFTCDGTQI